MTLNKYYFQALDNFPYNLEESIEALNYALSFDGQNAETLCLLGRVYAEILQDYETARTYFDEALQLEMDSVIIPLHYLDCLINNEEFAEAEKLINFSLKIKGIDKAGILYRKSFSCEKQLQFKEALYVLKEAKNYAYNKNFMTFLEDRMDFIKSKMKKQKNKSKKKRKPGKQKSKTKSD